MKSITVTTAAGIADLLPIFICHCPYSSANLIDLMQRLDAALTGNQNISGAKSRRHILEALFNKLFTVVLIFFTHDKVYYTI